MAVSKKVFRFGKPLFLKLQVAYNQALKCGEMLRVSSGKVVPAATATAAELYCIADQNHDALTSDDGVTHYTRCIAVDPDSVYEYPVADSSGMVAGSPLKVKDSQQLELADTEADVIVARVIEVTGTNLVRLRFLQPVVMGGASVVVPGA